jgi:lysophospholipase L1-like esterase
MQALMKQSANYCFISVGINDTYKKMGAHYYAQSTAHILRFLLQNNIKPILLEIPDYDINYAYEHQTTSKKLLRQLSMLVTCSHLDCREDYRQALMRQLQETGIDKQITILQFPYSMEYYQPDRMHLNNKGYQLLDSCICESIE